MTAVLVIASVAMLCVAWGLLEARRYHIREHTLRVLPPSSTPVLVLLISDLHLGVGQKRLAKFVRRLGSHQYDIVVACGDLLGDANAIDVCTDVLHDLAATSGHWFVFGSSDYYAPKLRNYLDYFLKRRRPGTKKIATDKFREELISAGWKDLNNTKLVQVVSGVAWEIVGLDDSYLGRDDRSLLDGDRVGRLRVCLSHDPSPYLDAASADYDLMLSGHTHGGQVRFPFLGAVVTNSDLPTKYARWSSQFDQMTLFVSPGLGTSRYAPFRFLCRPEASLLRLMPRS